MNSWKAIGASECEPAVDDVHHRHGQRLGIHTADVAVERQTEIVGGSAGYGQRNTQDGVGAQLRFGRRTVQRDHRLVDAHLIRYAHTDDRRSDDVIHVLHRLLDAFARITALVAVTQFKGFVLSRRSTARHGCTAECTRYGSYFDLDGRVTSRIEDFSCMDLYNLHSCKFLNFIKNNFVFNGRFTGAASACNLGCLPDRTHRTHEKSQRGGSEFRTAAAQSVEPCKDNDFYRQTVIRITLFLPSKSVIRNGKSDAKNLFYQRKTFFYHRYFLIFGIEN